MTKYIVTAEVEVEVDASDEDAAATEVLELLSTEATIIVGAVVDVREAGVDEVSL